MTQTTISPARQALIDKIKEIEERDYKSADAFARELKVDPGHLSRVKSGAAPPGSKFLRGLLQKHQETEYLIRNYLMAE